jgi:glycine/D-amino acid oxidase-like deaminating enzyme
VARSPNEDVAIVGAGIIGLSCAYFLARRGVKLVVLERKLPGAGSSTRNGWGCPIAAGDGNKRPTLGSQRAVLV